MTAATAAILILNSVEALAATCDAWICDIWGVLHNGIDPTLPAAAAAQAFRKRGGTICLVTNAPRPFGSVLAQMQGIGVPDGTFDAIVTSGDLTRRLITERADKRLFHLGPPKDQPIFEGLDVEFVAPEQAQFVICSGYYNDDVETPDDYAGMLAIFRRNAATMVCANPDIVVERGHRLVYCAGALAEAYEKIGGKVIYAGKPHLPAYQMAAAEIARVRGKPVDKNRILAIGDGLRTDMAGAARFGVRSLFIGSALHVDGALDAGKLDKLFGEQSVKPVAAMDRLVW